MKPPSTMFLSLLKRQGELARRRAHRELSVATSHAPSQVLESWLCFAGGAGVSTNCLTLPKPSAESPTLSSARLLLELHETPVHRGVIRMHFSPGASVIFSENLHILRSYADQEGFLGIGIETREPSCL